MSVIIKNMQMPKNCDECPLIHADGFNTCFLTEMDASEDVRPDWCPLEIDTRGECAGCIQNDDHSCKDCDNCTREVQGRIDHYSPEELDPDKYYECSECGKRCYKTKREIDRCIGF